MYPNTVFCILVITIVDTTRKSDVDAKKSAPKKLYKEKCYDGLGCVALTPEWTNNKHRPINVLPADRHAINTVFVSWDYKQNLSSEIMGSEEIKQSGIRSNLKIFIHDFTSNGYTGWIQHLSRGLLTNPDNMDLNIVSVDWAAGAEPPYVQAVANARLVALEVINFLQKLEALFKLSPGLVHIVGHGLGAHIAGYVGKMMRLHKITALDPSGPYFKSMPPSVGLHKDDAEFVEVIHTDTNGQGHSEILGHVDYFPNGGAKQPGCLDSGAVVTSVQRGDLELGQSLSACSHKRSLKYYIESSVNPSCNFVGVACSSHKDFLKGKCTTCGEKTQFCSSFHPMSRLRQVNNTRGFYFVTSNASPFCGEVLKVQLVLRSKYRQNSIVKGYFKVNIPQDIGDVSFFLNENRVLSTLRADAYHTFVVFRSTPPALSLPAKSLFLKWLHGPFPCSWCTTPRISSLMISKLTDKNGES